MHSEDHLLPLRVNLAKIKEEPNIINLKKQNKPNMLKLIYVFGKGQVAKKDLFK